jgi:hypothetical protein
MFSVFSTSPKTKEEMKIINIPIQSESKTNNNQIPVVVDKVNQMTRTNIIGLCIFGILIIHTICSLIYLIMSSYLFFIEIIGICGYGIIRYCGLQNYSFVKYFIKHSNEQTIRREQKYKR